MLSLWPTAAKLTVRKFPISMVKGLNGLFSDRLNPPWACRFGVGGGSAAGSRVRAGHIHPLFSSHSNTPFPKCSLFPETWPKFPHKHPPPSTDPGVIAQAGGAPVALEAGTGMPVFGGLHDADADPTG